MTSWCSAAARPNLGGGERPAQGARVVLADKGDCGSSGATAPVRHRRLVCRAGSGASATAAMAKREKMGGYLQDRRWMAACSTCTYDARNLLAEWGYPFPIDDHGKSRRNSLQGPEYMRLMRKRRKQAGVTILDHSPALELLVDDERRCRGRRRPAPPEGASAGPCGPGRW